MDPLAFFSDPEDEQSKALVEALRQQQRRGEAARAGLQETLTRQQGQAGGLRNLSLLTSMGANPLLQGLQREAGQQGAQAETLAARTEQRIAQDDASGLNPLRALALKQAEERLKLQQDEAARRAAAAEQALGLRKRGLAISEQKFDAQLKRQSEKDAKGTTLPATEVGALGSTDTALTGLDDLLAAHGTMAGGVAGAIGGLLPGTDAQKFDDKVIATAQVVGTILEHGKMTDGDIPKYRKMLPDRSDSPARAAMKVANVKRLLEQDAANKVKAFDAAGYNVKGFKQKAGAPTIDLNAPASSEPRKTVDGKTYVKRNGEWFEE